MTATEEFAMEKIAMIQKFAMLLMLFIATAVVLGGAIANAEEQAGRSWPAEQQTSIDKVDHQVFDQLLKKYVNTDGQVDYKSWHQSKNDREALKWYIGQLSCATARLPATRESQLAYWINAYNAVTIEGILRVYPTTSIRKHTAKLVGYNIWKDLKFISGDQRVSLEDIEHKILRKMGEPRIHFAIVCASIGCPRLLNEAYVPDRLEEQLHINTKDFFNRQQNLKVEGNTLQLSQIISWFGTDFAATEQEQVQMLSPYFPPAAQQLVATGNYKVGFSKYDWGLNTQ